MSATSACRPLVRELANYARSSGGVGTSNARAVCVWPTRGGYFLEGKQPPAAPGKVNRAAIFRLCGFSLVACAIPARSCVLYGRKPKAVRCEFNCFRRMTKGGLGRRQLAEISMVCFSVLFIRPLNFSRKRIHSSHLCRSCVQVCATHEEPHCCLHAGLLAQQQVLSY